MWLQNEYTKRFRGRLDSVASEWRKLRRESFSRGDGGLDVIWQAPVAVYPDEEAAASIYTHRAPVCGNNRLPSVEMGAGSPPQAFHLLRRRNLGLLRPFGIVRPLPLAQPVTAILPQGGRGPQRGLVQSSATSTN